MLIALIAVVAFSAVSFFGSEGNASFGKSSECIRAAYDGVLTNECEK